MLWLEPASWAFPLETRGQGLGYADMEAGCWAQGTGEGQQTERINLQPRGGLNYSPLRFKFAFSYFVSFSNVAGMFQTMHFILNILVIENDLRFIFV